MASVVGDIAVHDAPQPFDRIEMGTVWRNEVQRDPGALARQPFLHQAGMMVAGVVEETWIMRRDG